MRLGTRGSALALVQARAAAGHLMRCGAAEAVEIVEISTSGDTGQAGTDKRRWIDTIEQALLSGDIDLAIHSAKDLPGAGDLAAGMQVAAILDREDPRDALVGASSLAELSPGARVGTSSLRRRSQLLAERPDLKVVEVRGNVPTRIAQLDSGAVDALVLAAAGLNRLGLQDRVGELLDPALFVPAAGQGILALEGPAIPAGVTGDRAHAALAAERAIVDALGASCTAAVGCLDDGESLRVYVGGAEEGSWIRDQVTVATAAERVRVATERLQLLGARELLHAAPDS